MFYKKEVKSYNDYYSSGKAVRNLSVKDILAFPIKGNPDRQLTQEAAEYFQIRQEYSQEDGTTIVATHFPSYNQSGEITGFKRRDWTLDKEDRFHFTTIGTVKTKNMMFGQYQTSQGTNRKTLVQLEAEEDTYCAWQAALDNLCSQVHELGNRSDEKAKSLRGYLAAIESSRIKISTGDISGQIITLPFVGLNVGAPNAAETVAHNEKFVKSYSKYVLALDNDHLTEEERIKYSNNSARGEEATNAIASYLLTDNIYRMKYPHPSNDPDGYKDARDFVKAGEGKLLAELTLYCDNKYVAEKILNVGDITIQQLRKRKKDGIPLKYFPKLDAMHINPLTGELHVLCAPSGAGKSTISRMVEHDIVDYLRYGLSKGRYDDTVTRDLAGLARLDGYVENERLGIIRLEEDEEESLNSHYALDLGIDPKEFCGEPEKYLTEEQHLEIHNKWADEDKVKILDHFGSMPVDQLISKLKQMVFMYGCRWIVLDHISMLISGLRTGDERKELDIVMTELAAFCKNYNVYIFAIAHIKRKTFEPPKDKQTGEQLPFFFPVRKEDLRGSASLEQLSWVVMSVEPEELPNRSRGRVRLVSLKNRRGKRLGIADTLWMKEDGTFIDASDWQIDGNCYTSNGEIVHCFSEHKYEPLPSVVKDTMPVPVQEETEEINIPLDFNSFVDQDGDEPF